MVVYKKRNQTFSIHSILTAGITMWLEMKSCIFTFLLVFGPLLVQSEADENIDSRIYNGQDAVRGQFPYQARVLLKYDNGGLGLCGGSILSDTWIVCAAHCAIKAISATVYLGMVDSKNVSGVYIGYVDSTGILLHPLYDQSIQNYDVSLLRVNKTIPLSQYPYISTISLPSFESTNVSYYDNYNGTISGWGEYTADGKMPRILQWAPAHVMPHSQCIKSNHYPITENIICTDKTVFYTGICPGDSGGPLAVNGTGGVLRVIGATSWLSGRCNSTYSVQYAYLGSQGILSWLVSTTGVQPQ